MILFSLFAVPALGALMCILMRGRGGVALAAALAGCNLLQALYVVLGGHAQAVSYAWLPRLGINLDLAVVPSAAPMLVLTPLLTLCALLSIRPALERKSEFSGQLLLVLASLQGLFVSDNLGLFYIFFELMLLPTLILTARWGGEKGRSAALKFFLYTLLGSLPMLLGVLTLAQSSATGSLRFADLAAISEPVQSAVFWLFALAFLVKLPIFPLHGWQIDLYRTAPAPAVAVIAGAMSKAGVYGLIRICLHLLPHGRQEFAPVIAGLALVSLLYGAVCALGAGTVRAILAYSSLSHLGLVTLALFTGGSSGETGAVLQMFAHGVATGGLFLVVGALEGRGFTSRLAQLSGLARSTPQLAALALVLAMASLGCPGLCSFPAELAMLLGIGATTSMKLAGVAALAVFLAAWYGLRFYQGVMNGPVRDVPPHADLSAAEWASLLPLVFLCFAVGLFPELTLLQWIRGF